MMRGWAAAVAALFVCTAWALAAPPVEAFGNLPTLAEATISPDGNTLAYVRDLGAKRVVVAQTIADHAVVGMVNLGDAKMRGLQWADNQTLVITTSVTSQPRGMMGHRHEYFMSQTYNVVTKVQRALLEHVRGGGGADTMNVVLGEPQARTIDGRTCLFVRGIYFVGNAGYLALFRVDVEANLTEMVSNPRDTRAEDWIVDANGKIVAEASYDENTQHWKADIFNDNGTIHALDLPAPIASPHLEGLSEDGTAVVVYIPSEAGLPDIKQISLKDGSVAPWLHAGQGFSDTLTSSRTGRIIGVSHVYDRDDYQLFDGRDDRMWRSVKAAFNDAINIKLEGWSDDHAKVIIHVFGPAYGDSFALVDMTTHKAAPIGATYKGVDEIAPKRWIEYTAGDGRKVNAYLTLPNGRDAKNLPLVVLPHGGPHSRDEPGFDWFSQALASRGYAVLQPEFRGSDGFGLELLQAGFGEFGKKMQSDLSDGVRALAAQGMIDPKRVCIVGASYGGYAALAGATLDTGVYRCAVSIAGISDIRALFRYERWPNSDAETRGERFWDRFLAITDLNDPKLADISPIKHIDRVTIPILLIHGKDDTVVPYFESDDMADALKAAKKPYEFVTLSHEDHWLSKSDTRLQMLQATVKFLETYNPPN